MARKTDLNPQLQNQLLEVLRAGVPIADACAYVGITDRTYYYWMEKGAKGLKPYLQFFQEATRARVQARVAAVTIIRKAVLNGDVNAAEWMLERSDPTNWGRQTKVVIEGGLDVNLINELIRAINGSQLSASDVFQEMINELKQQSVGAKGTGKAAGGE